ncbi:hypothetical protein C8R42DRAFT_587652 [Lentinula raphanica]|nr:hypothetical protein C8R42DRAFT_587652 [Lentinula raphanica]
MGRSANAPFCPRKDRPKLEEIQGKLNSFDVKVTKLKHDVGGRKLKGVTGKLAQSKTAVIEQIIRCIRTFHGSICILAKEKERVRGETPSRRHHRSSFW